MITVALAHIITINGENPSLEQKVNALEKQLHEMKLMFDEHSKKLSIVENKTVSTCNKYYVNTQCCTHLCSLLIHYIFDN